MAGKFGISVKTKVPKENFEWTIFAREIEDTMRGQTAPIVKRLYDATVEGWKRKPTFSAVIFKARGRHIRTRVQPIGKNANQYNLVSAGAKKHPIFSLTTKPMSFQTGYRAATQPRILKSRPAQGFGRIKHAFAVMHPGFKGRDFHETIAKFYAPIFADDMRKAMDRAAKEQVRILRFLETV